MRFKNGLFIASLILTTPLAFAGPKVVMQTSMGDITFELNDEKAPISTENFLNYVDKDHYEGLVFHRVIPGFMIQGGGMDAEMRERNTGNPIKNESMNGLSNIRGSIAMARTQAPDSATAQFYINTVDNLGLDGRTNRPGYAVFGKVIEGMEVVDRISAVQTGNVSYYRNVPREPITILSVERID